MGTEILLLLLTTKILMIMMTVMKSNLNDVNIHDVYGDNDGDSNDRR